MRKKVYYLSTCSTCNRIIKDLGIGTEFEYQDIKTQKITPAQLEEMKALAGSFEALFSRRSQQFRARGLHNQELGENDYRELILDEYTFLKRPVFLIGDRIFVGNAKAEVEAVAAAL
ncbi:MAG: hypothetical protein H6581_18650 [Bacteroidia bacterium]|nr:hypothetical protein [Bacteroidia bacterium]